MNILWILLTTLVPLARGLLTSQTNSSVTTKTLVEKHGYPFEAHTVTTKDEYILEFHRIPYSPRRNSSSTQGVVFLMHGLSASSSDWIVLGPDDSLGYLLSDNGYDVWMGNARGNDYSRKHVKLSPELLSFWNFSFHEISVIDVPTMIDYISDLTGEQKVRYVGHSQGTTNYLVLTSTMPEWNDRFISAHFLAPVAYMNHLTNTFVNLVSPLMGQPNPLREVLGSMEFKPSKELMLVLSTLLCSNSTPNRILCENSLFLTTEFNKDTVNDEYIPEIMATTPSSVSTNQYIHFIQEFLSGYFRQYDNGAVGNLVKYGSASPPNYPLDKVKGPIFMYYGKADKFVARVDLDRLIKELPDETVADLYVVPIENFDHLAFMYTKNIREKVLYPLLKNLISIN